MLALYVNGKKVDSVSCDFVYKNMYDENRLFMNAIERLKIKNMWLIRTAEEWEIWIIHKSKMNDTR